MRESMLVDNSKLYEEFVDSFTTLLDKEIKKVYIMFIDIEKKLYIMINSHLHIRDSYEYISIFKINLAYLKSLK